MTTKFNESYLYDVASKMEKDSQTVSNGGMGNEELSEAINIVILLMQLVAFIIGRHLFLMYSLPWLSLCIVD